MDATPAGIKTALDHRLMDATLAGIKTNPSLSGMLRSLPRSTNACTLITARITSIADGQVEKAIRRE